MCKAFDGMGNQKEIEAALDAASWQVADTRAVSNAQPQRFSFDAEEHAVGFGHRQDFAYEMAEPVALVRAPTPFPNLKGAGPPGRENQSGLAQARTISVGQGAVDGERVEMSISVPKTTRQRRGLICPMTRCNWQKMLQGTTTTPMAV